MGQVLTLQLAVQHVTCKVSGMHMQQLMCCSCLECLLGASYFKQIEAPSGFMRAERFMCKHMRHLAGSCNIIGKQSMTRCS